MWQGTFIVLLRPCFIVIAVLVVEDAVTDTYLFCGGEVTMNKGAGYDKEMGHLW